MSIDYFPGATHSGKLFNINGVIWLVRSPHIIYKEEKETE